MTTEQVLRLAESATGVSVDHPGATPSTDAVRTQRGRLGSSVLDELPGREQTVLIPAAPRYEAPNQ